MYPKSTSLSVFPIFGSDFTVLVSKAPNLLGVLSSPPSPSLLGSPHHILCPSPLTRAHTVASRRHRPSKFQSTQQGAKHLDAAAKLLQSCPTLCGPMDSSPPGSSVHRILRQEHWSGLPFPSPKSLEDPRLISPNSRPSMTPHCPQNKYQPCPPGTRSLVSWSLEVLHVPGSPVVKTPHSTARGRGSIPGQGTNIPHAA